MPATPLPRSLEPLPGESLTGFVLRLSHRLDLRPTQVIDLTGLATPGMTKAARAPARLLFILEAGAQARFARLARLSREEVNQLTLWRWAAHYPPIADAAGRQGEWTRLRFLNREWVLPTSTRYCPQCLAGDASDIQRQHGGPWKLEWRLSIVFARLEHNRLLADVCPGCRLPALTGGSTTSSIGHGLIPGPGRPILHPAQFRNIPDSEARGVPCGTRLDSAEIATAALAPEQAALQRRLLEMLSPGADPAASFHAFADLRAAAAMITATWPKAAARSQLLESEGDFTVQGLPYPSRRLPRKTGGRWGGAPHTSQAAACVLRLADGLVTLPAIELRQAISDLMTTAPSLHAPEWGRTWALVRDDCSPSFQRELQQGSRRRFSPAVQEVDTSLVIPVRQRGYLPDHIPQRLPREWIEILLVNGAPRTIGDVLSRFRRAAAIHLVQATDGTTTADAARFLGFPRHEPPPGLLALTPTADHPWTEKHVTEQLPEAFEALALYIAGQSHPVDYHERRQQLAFWHLPQTDWENITGQLPPPRQTGHRYGDKLHRECASAYIWARTTSGEWRYAPIFRPPLSPVALHINQPSVRHALLRLIDKRRDRYYTALRQALNEYAQALAAPPTPSDDHRLSSPSGMPANYH
ncbi:TniQ family protein [Kitasatospora sp. NPDC089913]|uniref:TniQ family protein n=1 Tax=Kitasatospora sp. NPDC089913 TaxID=3364080 RepID=UPI00380E3722